MEREDLISGYFEQTLNASELHEFERKMADEIDFADDVTFRRQLQIAITHSERSKIKAQLQDFEAEISTTPVKKLNFGRWVSIAASIVLLLGVSIWYFNLKSLTSTELFDSYYQPFPNVVNPIVRGEQASNELNKAFILYEQGNYQDAINIFAKYSDENSVFYAGVCEMQMNKFNEAILYFDLTIAAKSTFVLYAKWYKSLALVKFNKKAEAISILKELSEESEFDLKDKVIELMKDLN